MLAKVSNKLLFCSGRPTPPLVKEAPFKNIIIVLQRTKYMVMGHNRSRNEE
jgi:hypothetical protein